VVLLKLLASDEKDPKKDFVDVLTTFLKLADDGGSDPKLQTGAKHLFAKVRTVLTAATEGGPLTVPYLRVLK
jgi:hypothetical protein